MSVASVLLLAGQERQRCMLPWLGVVGEPVRYSLEALAPCELPGVGRSWDVIVIDGASIPSDVERARVLRRARKHPHRFATTIYVCRRHPSSLELEHALAWTDDVVERGAEVGDRVRRRVQAVALAPWRRSAALRLEAERLGDRRLCIVWSEPVAAPEPSGLSMHDESLPRPRRVDRAKPFVLLDRASRLGTEARELVAAAFHEGRRVGVATVQESAERACVDLTEEVEQGFQALRPDEIAQMEAVFCAHEGSPIVAARFRGAELAISAVRAQLKRLAREELAAIERHDVRSAYEP